MSLYNHLLSDQTTRQIPYNIVHWCHLNTAIKRASPPVSLSPGFGLPRQQWSLNPIHTKQGHCGACRRKWQLTDTDLCPHGETQTMSHIVKSCSLTKLNGGLSRLHSADEDAVSWLTNYGSWDAYEKKKKSLSPILSVIFPRRKLPWHLKPCTIYSVSPLWLLQRNSSHSWQRRKSLLVVHCNYVCISHRFWDIQHQRMAQPWKLG